MSGEVEKENGSEYIELLKAMLAVGEAMKGTQFPDERYSKAERLLGKFLRHTISAFYLSQGTRITELGADFLDAASINVIGRAAFKSFLLFHHVHPLASPTVEFANSI